MTQTQISPVTFVGFLIAAAALFAVAATPVVELAAKMVA